jgi:uncharacterized SAM-binding protein YcdF (DUF218 family)
MRSAKVRRRNGLGAVRSLHILFRGLLLLILISMIWLIYLQWKVQNTPDEPLPSSADVGIVLGASLRSDMPSPGLQERLDLAVKLYIEGKFKHIIVSGGLDHNGSKLTEAEGMRLYLLGKGIPESAVWIEPEATSTYENLLFSKRIMDKQAQVSAIIMTHDFHGARSLDIARTVGMRHPVVATTASEALFMPYHKARETLAFANWELDKLLLKSGIIKAR